MGNRESAAKDTEQYRMGYPGQVDNPSLNDNLKFYQEAIRCSPGGHNITDFHKDIQHGGYRGNYDWLESDHSYIQWLFPIRERGMNMMAQVLQKHEADSIASDPALQGRVVESYKTMLDFYGMKLADLATGAIARRDGEFLDHYANLNSSSHNYLRITRILKCLGEMGLEHYKKPFVMHIFREIYENGHLTHCDNSCRYYWAETLKNDQERAQVEDQVMTWLEDNVPPEPVRYTGRQTFGGWHGYVASDWLSHTDTPQ